MEPIFKLSKTTLQEKSRRFNFTCIDCTQQIIVLGTDIGSCHLYSTATLKPLGQIIYLPNMRHSKQSQQKKQSIITSCKFSLIQHQQNNILLLIGTASGHLHLYNVDIVNCKSRNVQTILIDADEIQSVLWCELEKLMITEETDAIESLKIIVSVKCGNIYLLHLFSNCLNISRSECGVKIINVQLIHQCKLDEIIQTSFKKHFVLISCLTRCCILDFSIIYNDNDVNHDDDTENRLLSLPFVNGRGVNNHSADCDKYRINIYVIGTKLRHGYYGACFDSQSIDGCDQILSARKSGRVWVGETQSGSVRNTLRFKLPKIPNIFAQNNAFCTSHIKDVSDIIWNKESVHHTDGDDEDAHDSNAVVDYEFANVSDTVSQNLGILIPFGNWTLSYLHPRAHESLEQSLDLTAIDLNTMSGKHPHKRKGYHVELNNFGLKILDHNLPKLLQWYPNLGRIVDICVLESECCLYIIYEPLVHSVANGVPNTVYLGRIELCSPHESVLALIGDDRIHTAIDYLCAYKVRDLAILHKMKEIITERGLSDSDHHRTKLFVHYEESKQFVAFYENEKEEKDVLLTTYRRASMDYFAQRKEEHKTKWEPAKFDVLSTAQILSDSPNSPQVIHSNALGKLKNMGIKISKHISQMSQAMGNTPTPQPPSPSGGDTISDNECDDDAFDEIKDSFNEAQLQDSVRSIDFKQKQRMARARRKSAATTQVFIEAEEEEPTKVIKYKQKKKKKKRKKKKKADFAVIGPAPAPTHKMMDNKEDDTTQDDGTTQDDVEHNISIVAAPGSGSILALDPLIKPHQVVYDDDVSILDDDDGHLSISRIHQLLRETEKCDIMLRRRMRNELEEIEVWTDDYEREREFEREYAAVGLSNINYSNCGALMNGMSHLLGEYESLSDLKHVLFYKWNNKIGEKLSTVLTRMLCVFISVKIDIGKECENGVIEILRKFVLILDFKWVLKLCNTHKLHTTLRQLSQLQLAQNSTAFNRLELETMYVTQKYAALIKLIDSKYSSPFLLFQYLPLLCERGWSHLCYTIAVGYFPHCAPWFVRKYMYRYPLDHMNDGDDVEKWNNIFKSYTKYLKLLFSIHPRTRCNGLLVLDLITLTLSLNAPSNDLLFSSCCGVPVRINGYVLPTQYSADKLPQIHSENRYSESLTKYILSIMSDRSYYIEWCYLEIVCKQYGFWKGLYKVYLHFRDIESLILLCCYLDYAQPILNLLCDLCQDKYWQNLLLSLAFVNRNENCRNHRLNYEIVIQYMMRNIGANNTLKCMKQSNIVAILNAKMDNIIYKEIVKQKQVQHKRTKLVDEIQQSLTQYLLSQYITHNKEDANGDGARDTYKELGDTLANIKHSSDIWKVMSSVNVRPPTQRAAAPLEKNLTDLFTQLV